MKYGFVGIWKGFINKVVGISMNKWYMKVDCLLRIDG